METGVDLRLGGAVFQRIGKEMMTTKIMMMVTMMMTMMMMMMTFVGEGRGGAIFHRIGP